MRKFASSLKQVGTDANSETFPVLGDPLVANIGNGAVPVEGDIETLISHLDLFDFNIFASAAHDLQDYLAIAPDAGLGIDAEPFGYLLSEEVFTYQSIGDVEETPLPELQLGRGLEMEGSLDGQDFAFTFQTDVIFPGRVEFEFTAPTPGPDNAAAAVSGDAVGHGGPASEAASSGGDVGIALLGTTFAAKGGIPGPPDKSGGDDGGTGDDGVLDEYFSGDADGSAGYDIWIDFKGNDWTVDLQSAFTLAADYFTTVITDDIGGGGKYRGKIVDDVYVTAELKEIDGTGGILGQAGPTAVWTANDLTAAGTMEFDVADATDFLSLGLWDDIVTHELMHVLGFGSLWNYGDHVGLVTNFQYTGTEALSAYQQTPGNSTASYIPVEEDGGSGTAGGHWDESTLDNELMTGYINNTNYLSEFSVMALDDLGYEVAYFDYPYDNDVLIS